jgi:hypothetical protein
MKKTSLKTVQKRAFVATIISYVISGFSFAFGFAIALTGILNEHLKFIKIPDEGNGFYEFVKNSGRWYGLLFIAIGALLFSLTIYLTGKKSDKSEKLEATRKNRVSLNLENVETKETENN